MAIKFGTAGVRAVYGKELGVASVASLCQSASMVMGEGCYGVGYDTRKASSILACVASASIMWTGNHVTDLGLAPTPVIAYAAKHLGLKASLSFTASHNPPEYAGVKVFDHEGLETSREMEARIEGSVGAAYSTPKAVGGRLERKSIIEEYVEEAVASLPQSSARLRILVDCANGAGSLVTPLLLSRLGHRVVTVNSHLSWRFPGRVIEPKAGSLKETAEIVRRLGVDFGFAHDGDADRLVLIDKDGQVIPDHLFSALLLQIVTREQSGNVVVSSNTSLAVEAVAQEAGCRLMRAPLGKTPHQLRQHGGIFATEPSKVVLPSWGLWEDGVYAAGVVAQAVANSAKSLQELLNGLPVYHYLQKDLASVLSMEQEFLGLVREHFEAEADELEEIDGIRVVLRDGWIMFRRSGTEPKIRIYSEAKRLERAVELMQQGEELVGSYLRQKSI